MNGPLWMSARTTIFDEIRRVALEHKKTLAPLNDQSAFWSIGLDSLCFVILTERLTQELGVDPFDSKDDIALPVTIGDFIAFYAVDMIAQNDRHSVTVRSVEALSIRHS